MIIREAQKQVCEPPLPILHVWICFSSTFASFNCEINSLTNPFEVLTGCILLKVSSNRDLHKEVVSSQ